jgi:hypothetical protein
MILVKNSNDSSLTSKLCDFVWQMLRMDTYTDCLKSMKVTQTKWPILRLDVWILIPGCSHDYRRADNFRPVSFTVSAWEWVYIRNLSRLQRERRERERETSKWHVGETHSVLITAILLPQCLRCYWGKIVSLRMLTSLRLSDLRLTTAQQRSTGHNLPFDLYHSPHPKANHLFGSVCVYVRACVCVCVSMFMWLCNIPFSAILMLW